MPAVAKVAEVLMGVEAVDYLVEVEEVASCPLEGATNLESKNEC